MTIAKVIEVISEGDSIEAAMQSAITEASKTVRDVKQINIEHIEGVVANNRIEKYRVISKVTFVIERK